MAKVIDEVRQRDVSHVALFGNIQISPQSIQSLCELEIPITYFLMGRWFYGIICGGQGRPGYHRAGPALHQNGRPVLCILRHRAGFKPQVISRESNDL